MKIYDLWNLWLGNFTALEFKISFQIKIELAKFISLSELVWQIITFYAARYREDGISLFGQIMVEKWDTWLEI